MRATGVTLFAALTLVAALPAREPTKQELLVAIEKQLKSASETAGPCVGCVVVSRSDRYPKSATTADQLGKLGGYDVKEFLKLNLAPADAVLAKALDLSDVRNIPDNGYACGVVIDPAGLILTPYHVVEGATKVYVHLPGKTGSYANIHAADSRHDLAVLKLIDPPAQLTAIKFADVRVGARQRGTIGSGNLVILVANLYATSFGVDKSSAALGSISKVLVPRSTDRDVDQSVSYYLYGPVLELDALLSGGANSSVDGAAMLNLDGEMVGLVTSAAALPSGDRGPFYAFPADANFRRVVEILRRGEEVDYGYLGVSMDKTLGLQITSVVPRGPAAQAGVQGSRLADFADTITHVNDVSIGTYEELLWQIGSALAGNKVKMTVSRGTRSRDVEVALGKFAHKQPYIASVRPEPVLGLRVDYGSILAQAQGAVEVRAANGVPDGVSVRDLAPNSQAAAAFKKLGDRPERWLITHVNGTGVNTPAEFYKAAKGQASIKLTVRDPSELNPRDREVSLP
jgi:serine protease Do